MKHMQCYATTVADTTISKRNPSIRDTLRTYLKLGRLFTLIILITTLQGLGNHVLAQKPALDESTSRCLHPATTNGGVLDGETMALGVDMGTTTFVDVNGNGTQETRDGAYVDLAGAECTENIYTAGVVAGATYGFNLDFGKGYTFRIWCGYDVHRQ